MDETRRHNDVNHEYRIQPYQREKSNTIPTTQSSVIISQRTYTQSRDLTTETALPRTEGQVKPVNATCIPITLDTSKKPGGQRKQHSQLDQFQQSHGDSSS